MADIEKEITPCGKEITPCGNFLWINGLNYVCLIKQLGL